MMQYPWYRAVNTRYERLMMSVACRRYPEHVISHYNPPALIRRCIRLGATCSYSKRRPRAPRPKPPPPSPSPEPVPNDSASDNDTSVENPATPQARRDSSDALGPPGRVSLKRFVDKRIVVVLAQVWRLYPMVTSVHELLVRINSVVFVIAPSL